MQSEGNEKKADVVGKAYNNKTQASKEQTENKNMILNKDEKIENSKSKGDRCKSRTAKIWKTKSAMSKTSKSKCR